MKLYLVLIALLSLLTFQIYNYQSPVQQLKQDSESVSELFEKFKEEYGIQFNTIEEEKFRFTIFQQNLNFINEHNSKSHSGNGNLLLGINEFAIKTNEEYQAIFLHKQIEEEQQQIIKEAKIQDNKLQSSEMPSYFDWSQLGAITFSQRQGQCASSWAFSATNLLESQIYLKTGKLEPLSAQELVNCVQHANGCGAGSPTNAIMYAIKQGNLDYAYQQPYISAKSPKLQDCIEPYGGAQIDQNTKIYKIKPNSPQSVQKHLLDQPLSIGIDARSLFFQFYKSGTLMASECQFGENNIALTLVGYNDADENPFWIAKNNWGLKWGQLGYIQLEKQNQPTIGTCGMLNHVRFIQ